MKPIIKKLALGMLKLSFWGAVSILIPASILAALEYVSPKADLFPLFTISMLSLFWIFFLILPLILSNRNLPVEAVPATARNWRQNLPNLQSVGNLPGQTWNSTKGLISGFQFPAFNRNKFSNSFTAAGKLDRNSNEPVGILLIIEKKQAQQPKASAVSTSNR